MKQGGYHFSPVWKNLVDYVEHADIADIKRRVAAPGK